MSQISGPRGRRSVLSLVCLLLLTSCSSDGFDQKKYDSGLATYKESILPELGSVSGKAAGRFFGAVAAQPSNAAESAKNQVEVEAQAAKASVCKGYGKLASVAGGGDGKASRLGQARNEVAVLIQNSSVSALLEQALGSADRDHLLTAVLGVKTGSNGAAAEGVPALRAVGILAENGAIVLPSFSDPKYRTYADWLKYDSPALLGTATTLEGVLDGALDHCANNG